MLKTLARIWNRKMVLQDSETSGRNKNSRKDIDLDTALNNTLYTIQNMIQVSVSSVDQNKPENTSSVCNKYEHRRWMIDELEKNQRYI